MTTRTHAQQLASARLGEDVTEWVKRHREPPAGEPVVSYIGLARMLDRRGVTVTAETVRKWYAEATAASSP